MVSWGVSLYLSYWQIDLPLLPLLRMLWWSFTAHRLKSRPLVLHPRPLLIWEGPISPNSSSARGDSVTWKRLQLSRQRALLRTWVQSVCTRHPSPTRLAVSFGHLLLSTQPWWITSSFRPQSCSTVITLHLNYLFIRLFSLLDGELLVAVDFVPTCLCVLMSYHHAWHSPDIIPKVLDKE